MKQLPQVSVYDRMCWPEGELERALAQAAHRRELEAYFGHGEYALLAGLARRAQRSRARPGRPARGAGRGRARPGRPRVYLLPGLLGSQLGRPRRGRLPPDLLWVDPTDIVAGKLSQLRWQAPASGRRPLRPLGAVVYVYLPLKLRLEAAGFEVILHAYDWRADLWSCGRALAAQLRDDPAEELALVGHSMGGLLARAALSQLDTTTRQRIRRTVSVGTPHHGVIGAVQALRATYPALLRLAAIDRHHDAGKLAEVFSSFQSVYQLLPSDQGLDLLDPAAWPLAGSRPDRTRLSRAREFWARLNAADTDTSQVSIVGTGQRTATGLELRGGQFHYQISAAGDGTVASERATLEGSSTYSLPCEHSELPRSECVAAALCELILRGTTRHLRSGLARRAGRLAHVTDAGLRRALGSKLDWHRMGIGERRRYFNQLNAPPGSYWPPPAE